MTEQQIERWVEQVTDAIDVAYMSSAMSEARYKAALASVERRAALLRRDLTPDRAN
jgi:hypothetical protein